MITFARIAAIVPGKRHEAMTFAHEVVKLVADKVGKTVNISIPIGGNPGRILWVSTYDNLAEFDSISTKLLKDADYKKLLDTGAQYFGSLHDELWAAVE